jgi:threonine/homoserine/homoserine lactone efflux protein
VDDALKGIVMEYVLPLAGVAIANLLAAMSPGPAFVIVTRTAMAAPLPVGMASAAGMILGAWLWAVAAVFGLAFIFTEFAWLYRIVQVAGGVYLVYVAAMIWRGASAPLNIDLGGGARHTKARSFAIALASQLSNPKVVVFFSSVFLALLPAHAPGWVWAAALAIVLFNETLWYVTLALSFSSAPVRRGYARIKTWLDRAVAGVLGALGLKLILDRS